MKYAANVLEFWQYNGKKNIKLLESVLEEWWNNKGTRDQMAKIHWMIEKVRDFQKNICFCFIVYAKAFDCMDHTKLCKILKEMWIPDHLTYLFRNLYAGQEAQLELDMEQQTGSK